MSRIGDQAGTVVLHLAAIEVRAGIFSGDGDRAVLLSCEQGIVAVPLKGGSGIVGRGLHFQDDCGRAGVTGDDGDQWRGDAGPVELQAIHKKGESVDVICLAVMGVGHGRRCEICVAAGAEGDGLDVHGWSKQDACFYPGSRLTLN